MSASLPLLGELSGHAQFMSTCPSPEREPAAKPLGRASAEDLIFPPFGWRHAEPFPKAAVEVGQIAKAGIERNRADLFPPRATGRQTAMREEQALFEEEFRKGRAGLLEQSLDLP